MRKTLAIATFGCKVNQYESACILSDYRKKGFSLVNFKEAADIYIINTCTVTNRTDFKSRNAIRHALDHKKKNPAVKIIVTGCYAQLNRERIEGMGEIDLIIDNNNKDLISSYLFKDESPTATGEDNFQREPAGFSQFTEQKADTLLDRVRAFIKIQDGCDYFCSYCIVPLARGKPRSRKPAQVLDQLDRFVENGYREFVLTGINLGLYGRDLKDKNSEDIDTLAKLLREIEKRDRVQKIRLSSIEPQLISDDLMDYFRNSRKICRHLHIPLQSGSDHILQMMDRPYKTTGFRTLLQEIVSIMPDVAIGSDIIVGFPGETEELFNETYEFIKGLPLVYLHIFPYSRRPGTRAAEMKDLPSSQVVKGRCAALAELMTGKRGDYLDMLIREGVKLSGVLENRKGNYWTALSDHYIRFYYANKDAQKGDLVTGVARQRMLDGLEVTDNDRD